jgi:beta-glucosidase
VWDTFARLPGRVVNNDDGLIACDHYHRYKEDVAMMKELGIDAYRFSIAWPRIMPTGEGAINEKGLAFYDQLIDELLTNDITPWITLFHWDLPQALQDKYQGWQSKEVAKLFADYTKVVVERYSDRVKNWFTINEIRCFTTFAHRDGFHAPGGILPEKLVNQTIHNALLGHGLAVQAIRANSKQKANVGLVENLDTYWPAIDTSANIAAAKDAWLRANDAILLPALRGSYRHEFLELLAEDAPEFSDEEMKIIGTPCDFIGYNYYSGIPVRAATKSEVKLHGKTLTNPGFEYLPFSSDYPRTDMTWPITPKAIYYALKFTQEEFPNLPIYITENGMAAADIEQKNGEVIDLSRVEYLRTHLEMLSQAKAEGVNLKGYFVWSLMDNYEWSLGYSKRFGIYRVNYTTQERKLKYSGEYYQYVMQQSKFSE